MQLRSGFNSQARQPLPPGCHTRSQAAVFKECLKSGFICRHKRRKMHYKLLKKEQNFFIFGPLNMTKTLAFKLKLPQRAVSLRGLRWTCHLVDAGQDSHVKHGHTTDSGSTGPFAGPLLLTVQQRSFLLLQSIRSPESVHNLPFLPLCAFKGGCPEPDIVPRKKCVTAAQSWDRLKDGLDPREGGYVPHTRAM